jgi:hypothetical protein
VTRGLGGDREREGRLGRKHESELEMVGENCTIDLMHSQMLVIPYPMLRYNLL